MRHGQARSFEARILSLFAKGEKVSGKIIKNIEKNTKSNLDRKVCAWNQSHEESKGSIQNLLYLNGMIDITSSSDWGSAKKEAKFSILAFAILTTLDL